MQEILELKKEERNNFRHTVRFWCSKYYVPSSIISELKYGLTPEIAKILESLPENKKCDECSKVLWHCTCMVEIDGIMCK